MAEATLIVPENVVPVLSVALNTITNKLASVPWIEMEGLVIKTLVALKMSEPIEVSLKTIVPLGNVNVPLLNAPLKAYVPFCHWGTLPAAPTQGTVSAIKLSCLDADMLSCYTDRL